MQPFDPLEYGPWLLQVKCRATDASSKKSQTYSPFRSFAFDSCVFVRFDSVTYEVVSAIEVDRELVEESSSLAAWVAGRRVTVKQVLTLKEGKDLTTRSVMQALPIPPCDDVENTQPVTARPERLA